MNSSNKKIIKKVVKKPVGNYEIKLIKQTQTKKEGTRKQIEFIRNDRTQMDLEEIETLFRKMVNDYKISPSKIQIIGLNDERFTTLKGINDNEWLDEYEEEYLENKPEAVQEKLKQFFNVNFIIYQN